MMKHVKLCTLRPYFLVRFIKSRKITAVLLTVYKFNVGIHFDIMDQFGSNVV